MRLRQVMRRAAGATGLSPSAATRLAARTTEAVYGALHRVGGAQVTYEVPAEGLPARLVVAERAADAGAEATGCEVLVLDIPFERDAAVQFAETLDTWDHADEDDELERTSSELAEALTDLDARTNDLERLRAELEETNKGVMALYAELDQHAERLQRASEMKTKFLSNMSHEFRTPVSAILSLTSLLRDRADGELNPEQDRQVGLIERSAQALLELVSDLLDLARVEAGRVAINKSSFELRELFGGLRGMFRPTSVDGPTALVFEPVEGLPALQTDEGKVSQILRNLLSNALKFTPSGEVRVSTRLTPDDMVEMRVSDTGIGIPASEHDHIFDEFTQIDSPLQRRHRGTGLGLPLSRKLARLLGGSLEVESEPGKGSTFTARIPRVYAGPLEASLDGGPQGAESLDKERTDE